jgi:hypothetical protein
MPPVPPPMLPKAGPEPPPMAPGRTSTPPPSLMLPPLPHAATITSNGSAKRAATAQSYCPRAAVSSLASALVFASGASAIAFACLTLPHGRATGFGMSAISSTTSHT